MKPIISSLTDVHRKRWVLWRRWVAANALGELLGLGLTFVVVILALSRIGDPQTVGMIWLAFFIAVFAGAIEATLVGSAQWWAFSPWIPAITWRTWWLATLTGAIIAYVLGYLPSTLMSLGEQTTQAAVAEPPQSIQYLLAAGMGGAAGAVLSFAQWLALRRRVPHAGWWLPANMLAWMVGMPVIFWGIDLIQKGQSTWLSLLFMVGVLLMTGAVVGAIHGAVLVQLVKGVRTNDIE